MTDFEVANQILDVMGLFLDGFALLASLIFAYVTGAFYFLHRAPQFTKVVAFIFLLFALSFILILLLGAYFHFLALIDQVDEQLLNPDVAFIIQATHDGSTRELAALGFWTVMPVMFGIVAMCFWMTFFWSPSRDTNAVETESA